MGMYSTFEWQDGLRVDKNADFGNVDDDVLQMIEDDCVQLHKWDGHKLEGYWYDETVRRLKQIKNIIANLTPNAHDNFAQFQYEGGYQFRISFVERDGEKKVIFSRTPDNVFEEQVEPLA